MLRIAFLLFSLFILFGGAYDAYIGWKNPEPTRTTVADYAKSDKSKEWVILTDAKINLLKAVVVTRKKGGKISKLYVPIESAEFTQKDTISLLLDTDDKEILDIARQLHAMSGAEQLQFLVKEKDKLVRNVELSGRIASKHSMSSDRVKEMQKLIENLASDFYILDHNWEASLKRGLIIAGIGLFMLILSFRKKKKATE